MSVAAQIADVVADPNVAYLLLTLGVIGIVAEISNPGLVFPGLIGAIALVLAWVGLGDLPVDAAGIVLIGLAALLLVVELHADGSGVLGLAGLASFALGSAMLFDRSGAAPDGRVAPALIVAMTAIVAGCFVAILRATAAAHRAPVRTGIEALIGRTGVATTPIAPTGVVRVDGEDWTARVRDESIPAGSPVDVVAVDGVTLEIRSPPSNRR